MEEEKKLLNATLCLLVREDEVLLAIKAEKIGKGCWNGYGGEINEGEDPLQAAIRELKEESKVKARPEHLEKVGIIDFHNVESNGKPFICKMHVYLVAQWEGHPQETEEMKKPTWFKKDQLPIGNLMLADKYWMPIVLSGKKIIASAKYGAFQRILIGSVNIRRVDSFPED